LTGFEKGDAVAFEFHDGKGGVIKKDIPKARFDKLVAQGKIQKTDACVSYYFEPRIREPIIKNLIIGKDISREIYEKFKDAEGNIYIVGIFKEGEFSLSYVTKPIWDVRAARSRI
jgi:hypothetical protein